MLASVAWIASSSRSTNGRSAIGTLHPRAETLQGAELQLLHGAFGLVQPAGNVSDAPLLDKAFDDDTALIGRQLVDKAKEIGTAVGRVGIRFDAWLRRIVRDGHLSRHALRSTRKPVGGDGEEV